MVVAVAALDAFLLDLAGTPREHPVTEIAEFAAADRTVTRVEHLAEVSTSPLGGSANASGRRRKRTEVGHPPAPAGSGRPPYTARFGIPAGLGRVASDLGSANRRT